MAQFRGGMVIATHGRVPDDVLGRLLDVLVPYDGNLVVEGDRITMVFSFDASLPPGFAPGLVPAMPRLLAIGRSALTASGIDPDVIGLSVERVTEEEHE